MGGEQVAYWVAPPPARRRGYPIKTHQLWVGREPTLLDAETIIRLWLRVDREMRDWMKDPTRRRPAAGLTKRGLVYFARVGNRIKIGFSANPPRRVQDMQVGSAGRIDLLGSVAGTREREKAIHMLFRDFRLSGEWFEAEPALLDYIRVICPTANIGEPNMPDFQPEPDLLPLAKMLRAKIPECPSLAEPIEQIAKGARQLVQRDDPLLRRLTTMRIESVLFAIRETA